MVRNVIDESGGFSVFNVRDFIMDHSEAPSTVSIQHRSRRKAYKYAPWVATVATMGGEKRQFSVTRRAIQLSRVSLYEVPIAQNCRMVNA
eukprot:scaffold37917_cov41-Attheya_sp.AAC.1